MIKKLFKLASNGKTQEWTIECNGPMYRTSEGYVGGVITTTAWTTCEGKSMGKKNETSPTDQAIKEAEAKIIKQGKQGWTEDIDNITSAVKKIKPQLAEKYEEQKAYIDSLIEKGCIIAAQPKLDGIRAIGIEDGGTFTRQGNKHLAAPHIDKELQVTFEGIGGFKFDGEFYNHKFKADFNKIASIVRKSKPTEEDLTVSEKLLEYHIYDIDIPNRPFSERYAILKGLLIFQPYPYFELVETIFIDTKQGKEIVKEILDKLHKKWVDEGYEGSMIRNANSNYQNKRTKDLVKRKDWVDDEFELVDVLPGKGNKADMAASVLCKDKRGEEFSAGILGNDDYCVCLLGMKKDHIGKQVTIKYQNLTPDRKVPRFAKMKAIRDYE